MNTEVNQSGTMLEQEAICCPYCSPDDYAFWARENGFVAGKCKSCGLVYVNPRPCRASIALSVATGNHLAPGNGRSSVARRVPRKVGEYRRLLRGMYADVWRSGHAISWLDVGAGYGEVVQAVQQLAAPGSVVGGVEPMEPKVRVAQRFGLAIHQGYVSDMARRYDFVSLVHVFSTCARLQILVARYQVCVECVWGAVLGDRQRG